MSEVKTDVARKKRNVGRSSARIRKIAQIAMMGAAATVLMLFEFPLPFLAPPFYEMDFSEVPVMVGAFAMGPMAGIAIEMIKILMNFILNGTITAGVGEVANFIIGCSMIIPASFIYRHHKTRKTAVVGLVTGTVMMTVVGCVMNAFVLLPAYSVVIPLDTILNMGQAIHPSIDTIWKFAILLVGPFNLVKGILISLITLLLYKNISVLLKGNLH